MDSCDEVLRESKDRREEERSKVGIAPAIGAEWPGMGGIYVGLVRGRAGGPDTHLIVGPASGKELPWQKAVDFAYQLEVDGHKDFGLPTRSEQAVLYGNVPELFEPDWYWSSEKSASHAGYAWSQHFTNGSQGYGHITSRLRARAVRRLTLLPFTLKREIVTEIT